MLSTATTRPYDAEDLADASRQGEFKKVERILDGMTNFAQINRANEYGQTPLHKAAISGRPEVFNRPHVVHLLLEQGANDTIQDNFGATPLQRCKEFGHQECERALVRFPIIKEMNKRIQKLERDLESVDLDMMFLSEQIKNDKSLMDKALNKYRKSAEEKHAKLLEKRRLLKEQQMTLKKQQEERIKALSTSGTAPGGSTAGTAGAGTTSGQNAAPGSSGSATGTTATGVAAASGVNNSKAEAPKSGTSNKN